MMEPPKPQSHWMKGDLVLGWSGGALSALGVFLAYGETVAALTTFVLISYGIVVMRALYRVESNQLEILNHHRLMVSMGHLHGILENMKAELDAAKNEQRDD